ncbi:MAG: DUF445 domain-containing protein [Nakamurella multipartita]
MARKIAETKIGPPLGRISAEVFARGDHHPFVDMVAERCYEWIRDNYTAVSRVVSQQAPSWSPRFLDDMVADRIYNEVLTFARAVKDDPQHQLRQSLDTFLSEFAQDLQHDEATIERAESIKDQVVGNTEVRSLAASAWQSIKEQSLLRAAEDPDSPLRQSVVQGAGFGRRLREDPELTAKVDGWVADVAGYVARNHARNITGIIDDTVARWDGEATSRKIELQVGRDLQFIRIRHGGQGPGRPGHLHLRPVGAELTVGGPCCNAGMTTTTPGIARFDLVVLDTPRARASPSSTAPCSAGGSWTRTTTGSPSAVRPSTAWPSSWRPTWSRRPGPIRRCPSSPTWTIPSTTWRTPGRAAVLAIGARPTGITGKGFRAYLDPSGHPFCLCLP